MIAIQLTDETLRDAGRMGQAVSDFWKEKPGHVNRTGNSGVWRWQQGYTGELAFKALLDSCGAWYTHERRTNYARGDAEDFMVSIAGRRLTLDVKTCDGLGDKRLMTPEYAFQEATRNIYVGVRIVGMTAEVWGWLGRLDMEKCPVSTFKVPTRWQFLDRLRPIDTLVCQLDKAASMN